ncbi:hypothetical protein MARA_48720 [Mycolicibacterium arabiense]|uniref:PH domain-containing protein n=1 Tax=Mycolicibacterium arabiense TaxID=1286181 RepID=A0A7I7S3C9_9MYCO|nr:hypothetical protein MARA_48720 [Mycolicibacterium arabiense]
MLVRWTPVLASGVLGFTALLWLVPLIQVLRSDEPSTGGWIATAVLAIPFAWVCWRAPKALRGMGIEFDDVGIHPFDGRRTGTIAWRDVAAVGFGSYASRHRRLPRATVAALEVYLASTATAAEHPRLRHDWQPVDPPAPGLSAGCSATRCRRTAPRPAPSNGRCDDSGRARGPGRSSTRAESVRPGRWGAPGRRSRCPRWTAPA